MVALDLGFEVPTKAAARGDGHVVPDLMVVAGRDHSTIMSKMIDAEDPGRKALLAFVLH